MTDKIIFIIDRSASVQQYSQLYLDAINGILQIQRDANPKTLLTCALFNESVNYLCINLPISSLDRPVDITDLKPSGLTAFYNSIVIIVHNLLLFSKNTGQKPSTVIILTDGEDTCSKVSKKHTALQISLAKSRGWQFIYLGVTEESIRIGREIGCNTCILYTCSENSVRKIPNIVNKILCEKNIPNADIDISDLSNSMANVKI